MYFFYIDESGTRDPKTVKTNPDGTTRQLEHLYVLTAVSLYEGKWKAFERETSGLKLDLGNHLYRTQGGERFDLAACEIKSTWLRIREEREKHSPFLKALTDADRTRLSECFFNQLAARNMTAFSVVIDKRKLHNHVDDHILHKKAYELLLERIEHFLGEYHPKHNGVLVMDDTDKTINRDLAMKHAYFQRAGNQCSDFRHIVEYPFFTDSKLSNGIQLADLCGYNVYRAFRDKTFDYPYFQRLLPFFYTSQRTHSEKLDGLKVFPDDSELVGFAQAGCRVHLKSTRPADSGGS